nr:MAG TPA: hypothetical protein [Caudoviricetes sp.]
MTLLFLHLSTIPHLLMRIWYSTQPPILDSVSLLE